MNSLPKLRRDTIELKCATMALRFDLKCRKLMHSLAADFKYDPNQPREPAGTSNGGRWISAHGAIGGGAGGDSPTSALLTISSKPSAAYCWNQLQIDNLFCSAQFPAPRRASCYRQAMERYANCLTGKPLPPLNF